MKICVLGAGVVGVSTAYALARLGHEVIVIDKAKEVAAGASHANGAQLSYSHVDPFSGPDAIKKLPGYLLGTDPAIQLGLSLKPDYLKWGLSFLRNCNAARFKENKKARLTLARLSREAITAFERDLPENALRRTGQGKLVIAQTQSDNDAMMQREGSDGFVEHGQRYLTAAECREVEPALAGWQGALLGGIYSPHDNALDPVTYCKVLRKACEDKFGVKFNFRQTIQNIETTSARNFGVRTNIEMHDCDKVIVCLGNNPNPLLKPFGVKVPIYPMQGYSLTAPLSTQSPTTSITDLKNKLVFANLGSHMRIAGFVDANQSVKKIKARGELLLDIAKQHWPIAANFEGPITHWTHYRPMTPSGVPVIGESKVQGLYLNAGHGSLGYTFAAGSAMQIASAIGHAHKNTVKPKGREDAFN
ncbi:MAG: FAD-dependent oxidoreductase [Hellea sp.]